MNPLLLWLIWLINGLLAVLYTLLDHVLLLLILPPLIWLAGAAPVEQRPWAAAGGGLAVLAVFLVPAPIPLILGLMTWAGAAAVWIDRFNPKALRWRVNGGLALYALAALGFDGYAAYTSHLDPRIWSGVVASGEVAAVVAQGRSFLNTIAIWGLWIILPLGYLALLLQGIFVHPPTLASPAELIHTVRARGVDGGQ
jgi:hypothetical protein